MRAGLRRQRRRCGRRRRLRGTLDALRQHEEHEAGDQQQEPEARGNEAATETLRAQLLRRRSGRRGTVPDRFDAGLNRWRRTQLDGGGCRRAGCIRQRRAECTQRHGQLRSVERAVARLLGETAQHQLLEPGGNAGARRQRCRRLHADPFVARVRVERRIAAEQLVGQRTERVHVVRGRGRLAVELLRTHRERRAAARRRGIARRSGEAEVREHGHAVFAKQHVGGLEVAMHQPARMQLGKAVCNACQRAEQLRPGATAQCGQVAGRHAIEHGERWFTVAHRGARLQVGMRESLLQAHAREEPFPLAGISGHQDLQHAVSASLAIARLPHLRRATFAELAQQHVSRSENLPALEHHDRSLPRLRSGPAARPRPSPAAPSRSRTARAAAGATRRTAARPSPSAPACVPRRPPPVAAPRTGTNRRAA